MKYGGIQMSVVITREDLISYAEVDYIIKHMNERYISKLPQNLLNFFETMKDPDYEVYVNPYKPLQEQGLTKYALEIIALLHIKYWCENKERKEELLEKMRANQEKFEAQLREQFSTDKLFENDSNKINSNKISTQDPMVSAYSKYMEVNPDIQDYTDLRENEEEVDELPENIKQKESLFTKIKLFVSKIFSKKSTD
jgi:hypothetical protein